MLNVPLLAALIAWAIAQLLKVVISFVKVRKFDFVLMVSSGGMPSSHSSTVTALAVCCGYIHGFESTIFAIACVLALVVMYDAAGVRRAVGEQAKILNKIVDNITKKEAEEAQANLKELVGHTPLQVFFGSLLGILIGVGLPLVLGMSYAA